jgi:hypothetical protein
MTDEKVIKLAKTLHTETVNRVGGPQAWGRMTDDVKAEAYATTAWNRVYQRWDAGTVKVTVEDVALAYTLLNEALNADAT